MAHYRTLEIYEILEQFSQQKTKSTRLEVLRKYQDVTALKDVLRGTFDDSLVFLLPEGKPPYSPNLPESVPSTLLKQNKQFAYFVKGGPGTDMQAYKRESLFIRLLESIHPADAEIVLSMVNKTSPVKYLTKKLVQEAFPNLIQK